MNIDGRGRLVTRALIVTRAVVATTIVIAAAGESGIQSASLLSMSNIYSLGRRAAAAATTIVVVAPTTATTTVIVTVVTAATTTTVIVTVIVTAATTATPVIVTAGSTVRVARIVRARLVRTVFVAATTTSVAAATSVTATTTSVAATATRAAESRAVILDTVVATWGRGASTATLGVGDGDHTALELLARELVDSVLGVVSRLKHDKAKATRLLCVLVFVMARCRRTSVGVEHDLGLLDLADL